MVEYKDIDYMFFGIEEEAMNSDDKIDIVIPWVDPSDSSWQADRDKYSPKVANEGDNRAIRYRDWDNLHFVFRGIEKYAPWINKVYFITYGHLPRWLNVNAPKLQIVKHEDYIPKEYLPLFSSHGIELNMHRIEGLSEKFIYFNDDIFLLKMTKPEDFFQNDLPCDVNISNLIMPDFRTFSPILFNTVACINKHFSRRIQMRKSPGQFFNIKYGIVGMAMNLLSSHWGGYVGFYNSHLAFPYLKSTLQEVWDEEPELLDKTCRHRFRNNMDVNQYIFRYWQLASGQFIPSKLMGKSFNISSNNDRMLNYINKSRGKMICINDHDFDGDFDTVKAQINDALSRKLPEKSCFEI